MKFIRKVFFFSLVAGLVWLGIFTYSRLTDGFSVYQMSSSLPPCPQFDVTLSPEKKEFLQTLFDQKFYYLGKGCQFYVFESEDGKYVLKFLKHKHLRLFTWLESIPMPQQLHSISDAKITHRRARVDSLFTSCFLAYEKIPEETGLFFIHLNRVPAVEKRLTLIDKIGCKHTINIDDYEYFVQKKGVDLLTVFLETDESKVPHIVQQMANLVLARCEKGVRDRDPAFVQNIAMTEEGPIMTDFGQLCEDSNMLSQEEQSQDLKRRLASLRTWLEVNFPNYTHFIPQVI